MISHANSARERGFYYKGLSNVRLLQKKRPLLLVMENRHEIFISIVSFASLTCTHVGNRFL